MIEFLTAPEVLTILESQLKDYGGVYGVRDPDLLHSALYTPQSSFNGEYLHKTIPARIVSIRRSGQTVNKGVYYQHGP